MNQQSLLKEILKWSQHNIATFSFNVPHQFDKRPVIVDVPQQIGQKDQKSGEAPQPDPLVGEYSALFRQHKANHDSEAEDGNGIFLFHAKTGNDTKPKPVT